MALRRSLVNAIRSPKELPLAKFRETPNQQVPIGIEQWDIAGFLKAIGRGVEAQEEKIAGACTDLRQLLEFKDTTLKKLGVSAKHTKLITRFTRKYKLGLWVPHVKSANKPGGKKGTS